MSNWLTALFLSVLPLAADTKIVVKGSDTLGAKLVPQLKEAYLADGNQVNIEISAEGSEVGFSSLEKGTADIGMSSREAKPEEINRFLSSGRELKEHTVGWDMIAVVVHEQNPVKRLDLQQVEKIFTGEVTTWSEVGGRSEPISIYTRNTSSGTYKSFQTLAMNKNDYSTRCQKLAGNEQIATEVSSNRNGIGYVGLAYATKTGLLALRIDGMRPSPSAAGKYPLARKLYFYTVGNPTGEVRKFIEWTTTSRKAAEVIRKVGFIPNEDIGSTD